MAIGTQGRNNRPKLLTASTPLHIILAFKDLEMYTAIHMFPSTIKALIGTPSKVVDWYQIGYY